MTPPPVEAFASAASTSEATNAIVVGIIGLFHAHWPLYVLTIGLGLAFLILETIFISWGHDYDAAHGSSTQGRTYDD